MLLKFSVLNITTYIPYKQKQFEVLNNLEKGNKGILRLTSMRTADNKLFLPLICYIALAGINFVILLLITPGCC